MNLFHKLAVIHLLTQLSSAENLLRTSARNSAKETSPDRFRYFDVELLQERSKTDSGNVVISPASVKSLMTMVLEGSRGKSAEQLRQALRIEESGNVYREHLRAFLQSLKVQKPGYTVELGNRMFVSNKVTPRKEYREALDKYYHADIRQVDFSSPQITATTINDWVSDRTHGFISKLVEPDNLSPYSKMVLANAIYFKGKWEVPFDPEITSVKNFYPEDGVCHTAFYMETFGTYPYAYIEELNAQALELPYQGNKFAMLLLMSKDAKGVNQLVRDLPYRPPQNIISKLVPTEVLISVPRFKMEYSTDLVTSLGNLGVIDIFGPNANLSGMLTNGEAISITNIFHKAKIEVNEEGSIAGAGTGAIGVPLMGKTSPRFHANKPFLFFIHDVETGNILFEGRVSTPELATQTCSNLKIDEQSTVRTCQDTTNTPCTPQVPNIQQSTKWLQQRPNFPSQQSSNNPTSRNKNSQTTPYAQIPENQENGQSQKYGPYINRTNFGDRDAIQFSSAS